MNITLHTDGSGYWSKVKRPVKITDIVLDDDRYGYGELMVYFDHSSWDNKVDGLIYTDKLFLKELKEYFASINLPNDIDYSEQGMQGKDYVSLDAGKDFVKAFRNKK